jgi:hypothetical protein
MIVKNDANTYPDEAIMEEQPKKFVRDNFFQIFARKKTLLLEVHFPPSSLSFHIATKEKHAPYQSHYKTRPHFEVLTQDYKIELASSVQNAKKRRTL